MSLWIGLLCFLAGGLSYYVADLIVRDARHAVFQHWARVPTHLQEALIAFAYRAARIAVLRALNTVGPSSVPMLAKRLHEKHGVDLDAKSLTMALEKIERDGFVTSKATPPVGDRGPGRLYTITERGQELIANEEEVHSQRLPMVLR